MSVRIVDRGSWPERVQVLQEGVPTTGVEDSGADITIMNSEFLKCVSALTRSMLEKVDNTQDIRWVAFHPTRENGLGY